MSWKSEHNKAALDALIPAIGAKHGCEAALGEASRWTQVQHITRLVKQGIDVDCRIGERRVTPLMMAGATTAAKTLLELGADTNARDAQGRTALMWLFIQRFPKRGSLSRVKLLLNNGADVNLLVEDGLSAYDFAKRRSDIASSELVDIQTGESP